MPDAYRMFTPGPQVDVPFMPKAVVTPQQIALGLPQAPPAAAAPATPGLNGPFGTAGHPGGMGGPFGFGAPWNPVYTPPANPIPWGQHPAASAIGDPRSIGSGSPVGIAGGYQTPMQIAAAHQTAAAGQPAHPFNAPLANAGLAMMNGQQIPFPQLLAMLRSGLHK